jgi:predicted nucleotidyltransferase
MADILTTFTDAVTKAYGRNLLSIILYGSMANGEESGKRSDYNLLIILDKVGFEDLRALKESMEAWLRAGNHPPLLFARSVFEKSTDVFPIEFLDIKDNRRVLYGDDPFSKLAILDTNLRHECEFELKSKLLKLRQGYMACHDNSRRIEHLMTGTISSVLTVLRHVVRLLGKVPPARKRDALPMLAEIAGIDVAVFETVLKMKHGDEKAAENVIDSLMGAYLSEIEKVITLVDDMDK